MNMLKLACLIQLLFFSAPILAESTEDSFPTRPLTLLIGFEPGGTIYTQAEVLAEVLSEELGQTISLQRKTGLGGGIAAAMIANSTAQGYIILFTPSFPITDYPSSIQSSYEISDFRFIASVSEDQHALVTSRFSSYSDWAGFIDYARQQGEITYASQNLTDRHLINSLAASEGFKVRVIPVSGGAGMAPLILSGDVDLAFSGGTHSRYSDSGEMVVLASLGTKRMKHYPDAPTLTELGYDLQMQTIRLLAVPADTPQQHINKLAAATERAIQDPRFIEVTEKVIRQPVAFLVSDELSEFLHLQHHRHLNLIEQMQIR